MNKYLLEILLKNKSVRIPNIGTLSMSEDNQEQYIFNPYIKFNDGILEEYVENNSNMDINESKNFVAKYSREILSKIENGEEYSIYELGVFSKKDDEIIFTQKQSNQIKNTYVEPEEKIVKNKISIKKTDKSNEKKVNKNSFISQEEISSDNKRKPKKRLFVLLFLLLLLLLFCGIYFGLNWETYKSYFESSNSTEKVKTEIENNTNENQNLNSKKNTENTELSNEESNYNNIDDLNSELGDSLSDSSEIESEEELLDKNVENYQVDNQITNEFSSSSFSCKGQIEKGQVFHIVIGLYKINKNAENVILKLRERGINTCVLGKYDGMNMVIYKSYKYRNEAINDLVKVKKSLKESAWIFRS